MLGLNHVSKRDPWSEPCKHEVLYRTGRAVYNALIVLSSPKVLEAVKLTTFKTPNDSKALSMTNFSSQFSILPTNQSILLTHHKIIKRYISHIMLLVFKSTSNLGHKFKHIYS